MEEEKKIIFEIVDLFLKNLDINSMDGMLERFRFKKSYRLF